jgi:hypothetical protein
MAERVKRAKTRLHHLRAVEAGVEHVHRHENLRERLLLEAANLGHRVHGVVGAGMPDTT